MNLLRLLARPMLASAFIVDGVDAVRHAGQHAEKIEPFHSALAKVSEKVPGLPSDPTSVTRILGLVQIGAGSLLAIGKAPRLAAATLAVISIPTTLAQHPVWEKGPERRDNIAGLARSGALLAGLVFAAEDRQGKPSIGWRYGNWRDHRAELGELRSELKAEVKAAKASD